MICTLHISDDWFSASQIWRSMSAFSRALPTVCGVNEGRLQHFVFSKDSFPLPMPHQPTHKTFETVTIKAHATTAPLNRII